MNTHNTSSVEDFIEDFFSDDSVRSRKFENKLKKAITTRDASIRTERDKEILENILRWSKNVTVVETTGREGAGKATKKLRDNLAGCYHFLYQALRLDTPTDTTTHNEDKSV